jgi:endonuclease YncB( thermonuclease family)
MLARTDYVYMATFIDHVTDGDTFVVRIDHGKGWWELSAKYRLKGCNAWEHATEAGQAALANLQTILTPGRKVTLYSYGPYKYGGEFMGDLDLGDGQSLVDMLVLNG